MELPMVGAKLPASDDDYDRILIDNFYEVLVDDEFNVITGL